MADTCTRKILVPLENNLTEGNGIGRWFREWLRNDQNRHCLVPIEEVDWKRAQYYVIRVLAILLQVESNFPAGWDHKVKGLCSYRRSIAVPSSTAAKSGSHSLQKDRWISVQGASQLGALSNCRISLCDLTCSPDGFHCCWFIMFC